jgi:phosphoglycolate phosphatase
MIKQIILDLDGTLLDIRQRHYQCYCDIVTQFGFAPVSVQHYWQQHRAGIGNQKILQEMQASSIADSFLKQWINNIEERNYLRLDALFPKVVIIMQNWKNAGIELSLATLRHHKENLSWQLKQVGIDGLLKHVIIPDLSNKADKATAVREQLHNLNSEQALWIGDTEADVHAAKTLGIKVCTVNSGLRSTEFLAALQPDFQKEDLLAVTTCRDLFQ